MAKAEVFKDVKYPDRLNKRESKVVETAKSGCLNFARRSIEYTDFVDGSVVAIGDALPKGAILQRAYVVVSQAFTCTSPDAGDSVSLAVKIENNTLLSETDNDSTNFANELSSTGTKAVTALDGSLSKYKTLSADSSLTISLTIVNSITSEDDVPNSNPVVKGVDEKLTAGKFDIVIEYVVI